MSGQSPWYTPVVKLADPAKAIALGAGAVAIGHASLIALNCNKDIPEANYQEEMGVEPGYYHCHSGRCPRCATRIRSCASASIRMQQPNVYTTSCTR